MPTAANGRARISKRTLTAVGGEHDDPAAQKALAPEERVEHGIGSVRVECGEAVVEECHPAAGVYRAGEGLRLVSNKIDDEQGFALTIRCLWPPLTDPPASAITVMSPLSMRARSGRSAHASITVSYHSASNKLSRTMFSRTVVGHTKASWGAYAIRPVGKVPVPVTIFVSPSKVFNNVVLPYFSSACHPQHAKGLHSLIPLDPRSCLSCSDRCWRTRRIGWPSLLCCPRP